MGVCIWQEGWVSVDGCVCGRRRGKVCVVGGLRVCVCALPSSPH